MVDRPPPRATPATWVSVLLWLCVVVAVFIPMTIAATSPLLAWRDPVYIAAGFAGVIAMALLLIQPLLAGGYLTGVSGALGRRIHRWVGGGLLAAIVIHVAGLWLTSPPDVIDALLFRSPTPFSVWGVLAMWAVFATALLAAFRRRLRLSRPLWRFAHSALAIIVATGTVIHALQIEGTMGTVSKGIFCVLVLAATGWTILDLRSWAFLRSRRQ